MTELVGYIAAFLTTASFLPQAIQTIKTRNTDGISLAMYSMFVAGVLCWLTYGILIGNFIIVAANVITLVLASVALGVKVRNGCKNAFYLQPKQCALNIKKIHEDSNEG